MAYGVRYRISYCNKENVTARLDIEVRGYVGAIENVIGTTDLFKIGHKNENDNKTGYIISTFADINLYEHPITIDDLKTLDETAIRISYYIAGVLKWQGFALPDFFETEITQNAIVSISATDRLSALKERTLSRSELQHSPISIISECLQLTGLNLNINSVVDFRPSARPSTFNIMRDIRLNKQRLTDDKGRDISAFDTLTSILALFNCYIVQRDNEWWIVNKYQLENGGGKLYKYNPNGTFVSQGYFTPSTKSIDLISVGGRRKIEPSAFEVSLYGEYGGMPLAPTNYDFSNYTVGGFTGWTAYEQMPETINTRNILGYSGSDAVLGNGSMTQCFRYKASYFPEPQIQPITTQPSLRSEWVDISGFSSVNIEANFNLISKNGAIVALLVVVKDNSGNYWTFNNDEAWVNMGSDYSLLKKGSARLVEISDKELGANDAVNTSKSINYKLNARTLGSDVVSLDGCSAQIWIMGTALIAIDTFITSAKLIVKDEADAPRGTMAKVQQYADFSKKYSTATVIFSDYVRNGINGFFYGYRADDTSIIRDSENNIIGDGWTNGFGSDGEYLILASTKEMSRLFSSARDILTIEIDSNDFDILNIYQCANSGKQYIATSLSYDFFRSKLSLTLEENVISNTTKRDFLYSYFGGSDSDNIKSVGGISGGSSGGGGGSSAPQYWQLDENGNLFTEYNAYSTKELSAYGIGSGSGGGGGGSLVSWGTEANSFIPLTVEGISKTVALLGHTHTKAQIGLGNVDNTSDLSKPISTATQTALNSKFDNPTGITSQYIRGDGSLATYTDTTYSLMSLAELNTGTATTNRVVNSKNLNDWLNDKGYIDNYNGAMPITVYSQSEGTLVKTDILANQNAMCTVNIIGNGYSLGNINTQLNFYSYNNSSIIYISGINLGIDIGDIDVFIYDGVVCLWWKQLGSYQSFSVTVWYTNSSEGARKQNRIVSITNAIKPTDISRNVVITPKNYSLDTHTHTFASLTSKPTTLSGYGIANAYTKTEVDTKLDTKVSSIGLTVPTGFSVSNSPITSTGNIALAFATGYSLPTTAKQGQWDTAFANSHTHANKTQLDLITQSNIDVLAKLSIVNGNLQIDGNAYATGELSAYGAGTGGGGGGGIIETVYGYGNLGQTFNNNILTDTFNAYTINQINNRLSAVEGGSATTINTTGAGNAITALSKSGNTITATKGLSFSLSTHNHDTIYKPFDYVPSWSEITGKPSTFAPSAHNHPISDITNLQNTLNNKLETSIFNTHNTDNVRHITGAERTKWDKVVTDFDELEIGGRNLLKGSSDENKTINNIGWGSNLGSLNVEGGKTYRVRLYIEDTYGRIGVQFVIQTPTNPSIESTVGDYAYSGDKGYIEKIYTMPPNAETAWIQLRNASNLGSGSYPVTFRKLEVKEGNFYLEDWTPAPEDQVSDWLTTDVNSFSFIKNKPTSLSQFTDNIGVTTHIANKANPHSVTKAQVGLENVDNTSDLSKPISTAVQTALNLKADLASPTFTGTVTAPAFSGAVSGNATTATTATNLSRSIIAGNGLSGGGALNADRTVTLGTPSNITLSSTNEVTANSHTHNLALGGTASQYLNGATTLVTIPSITAGNGLSGGGQLTASQTLTLGTPSTLDASSTNAVTAGSHTHSITTTSVGLANTIVQTDASGGVRGNIIRIGANWTLELVGTELQVKYNGALKQRFLADGSFVATGEVTAYE